jgi:dienelactone hydrolase
MKAIAIAGMLLLIAAGPGQAQFAPPAAKPPDAATLKEIETRLEKLDRVVSTLERQGVKDNLVVEVAVFHKAAAWITRHQEFFQADSAARTLETLDRGLLRASQVAQGEAPWLNQTGQAVVRAYRSHIDGSVQPYAITLPADYGQDPRRKWRLDVVLHGRDSTLTEVKFITQYAGDKPAPKEQDFVQLTIFGRGNNAYRWAGEMDVLEAIDAFVGTERLLGRNLIDPRRVVLRGFSMGGAGTWHLGLHRPERWCVIGPGAGFTTTHGYIKDLPEKLPEYQEACLRIYDAVDYAANAFNVPVVAYSGDQDAQMQAAVNIEERLKALGIPMTHIVAPGLAHAFPPEWQKKAHAEYATYAAPGKGRKEFPPHIRFVTYTLRYPSCDWVEILGLDRHYQRAEVDARITDTGLAVQTTNVRALRLGTEFSDPAPQRVRIDGQEVFPKAYPTQPGSLNYYLERRDGRWQAVLPQKISTDWARRPQKVSGLQGPIDDAFMDSFLCVRGTGEPWHATTQKYADDNLKRFQDEWSKYLRGELPIKDDTAVSEEDIAGKHLILFGDPASNSLIAQVLDSLPLKWNKESITLAGKTYPAADHVPVLIYPSPLNSGRYVVLNSGHTFHAADFRGTNALLYPRLGDYAVLQLQPTDKDPLAVQVKTAGLFDDFWK